MNIVTSTTTMTLLSLPTQTPGRTGLEIHCVSSEVCIINDNLQVVLAYEL